jgi:hypothetical protein
MQSDPKMLDILTRGLNQWLQGDNDGYDLSAVPVKCQRLVRRTERHRMATNVQRPVE